MGWRWHVQWNQNTLGSRYTDCPYTETPLLDSLSGQIFLRTIWFKGSRYMDCPYTPGIKLHSVSPWYTDICLFVLIASPLFCPYTEIPHLGRIPLPGVIDCPYTETPVYFDFIVHAIFTFTLYMYTMYNEIFSFPISALNWASVLLDGIFSESLLFYRTFSDCFQLKFN